MIKLDKDQEGNVIQKIAQEEPARRRSLLTDKEKSVVFGLIYAAIVCGLTMLLDLVHIPDSETALWCVLAVFFFLLMGLHFLMEWFLFAKLHIKRTLFYVVGQLAVLVVIIVMIVIGVRTSGEEYYASRELAYAMAFTFTELAIFLYHLLRVIVRAIFHSNDGQKKTAKKKTAKKK